MNQKININYKNDGIKNHKTSLLIVGYFEGAKLSEDLNQITENNLSKILKIEKFNGKLNKHILIYGNKSIPKIIIYGLGDKKSFDSHESINTGAKISKIINQQNIKDVTFDIKSFGLNRAIIAQNFIQGIVLGNYQFLNYKTIEKKKNSLTNIIMLGNVKTLGFEVGQNIAEGVNYARDLGNHPGNVLTPSYLAKEAQEISKAKNMKSKIIDVKDFEKLGLHSFYSVARGSLNQPAKFIIVEYNGAKKSQKPLALVGKGLTFDTGGISIKPAGRMDEMKFDMCGSATVMGVMKVVAELQPKINILFAIGSTENMPDGNASKPGDIVKAYNGKTIEILNTDAEGRLVLADVLSYVETTYKPDTIIDFATLTGAVLVALGDKASGIMTNNEELVKEIISCSKITGERVWELPLWDEYSKDIKSKIADIKNLGKAGLAGTISAGAFLKEFVKDTPWVHMDIAGTAWGPKDYDYMPPSGATGVGVRLIYNLIQNRSK